MRLFGRVKSANSMGGNIVYRSMYLCYTPSHVLTALSHLEGEGMRDSLIVIIKTSNHFDMSLVEKYMGAAFPCKILFVAMMNSDNLLMKIFGQYNLIWHSPDVREVVMLSLTACKIYIFHDKPLLSRLVLNRRRCYLIEEGASNYKCYPVIHVWLWKLIGMIIGVYLPLGRHRGVESVLLKDVRNAPSDIRNKCTELHLFSGSMLEKQALLLYKNEGYFKELIEFISDNKVGVVIGQDLAKAGLSFDGRRELYVALLKYLKRYSEFILFKPHPNDNSDYNFNLKDVFSVNRSLPMPLFFSVLVGKCVKGVVLVRSSLSEIMYDACEWDVIFPELNIVEDIRNLNVDHVRQVVNNLIE